MTSMTFFELSEEFVSHSRKLRDIQYRLAGITGENVSEREKT